MITKIKKVYYCEYCKKHSLRPLRKHEKYCTGNPNRECQLCNNCCDINKIVAELIKENLIINESDSYGVEQLTCDINEIKNRTGDCPNCTLAVIRQLQKLYTGRFYLKYFEYVEDYKKRRSIIDVMKSF
jgi:hypothetical protein